MGHMEKAPGLGAWGRVLVIVRATALASGLGVRGWAWCSWVGLVFAPVLRNRRVKWWEAAPLRGCGLDHSFLV